MSTSENKLLRFAAKLAKGELTDSVEDGVVGEPWVTLALHLEQARREWMAERAAAVEQAVRQVTALSNVANQDGLTGLLNRRAMESTLDKLLRKAMRESRPLAVAMLDLDHFKRTNDTYGHAAGDAVLRAVGALLQESVRKGDAACRPGGEEFVLVLPDLAEVAAYSRLQRIVEKIRALEIPFDGRVIRTTVSAGLACHPEDGNDAGHLLHLADEAMYRAKTSGRDRLAPPTRPFCQAQADARGSNEA